MLQEIYRMKRPILIVIFERKEAQKIQTWLEENGHNHVLKLYTPGVALDFISDHSKFDVIICNYKFGQHDITAEDIVKAARHKEKIPNHFFFIDEAGPSTFINDVIWVDSFEKLKPLLKKEKITTK